MRLAAFLIFACSCRQILGLETPTVADGAGAGPPSPRRLVIDNSASTTALVTFPVLVTLDPSRIDYARVSDPATELRFGDEASGVDLPFEIEAWNPGGRSVIWVEVSKLDPGVPTRSILMYFGPGETSTAKTAMWRAWRAVNHLATTFRDSAPGGVDGSAVNVTSAPGIVGQAAMFSGIGDNRITIANGTLFDGWTAFTLELWLRPDYSSTNGLVGEPAIISKGTSLRSGRLLAAGGGLRFQIDLNFVTGSQYPVLMVPADGWSYVVFSFDGLALSTYRDGQLQSVQTVAERELVPDSSVLVLGATTNPVSGEIDELRIAPTAFSADWILATNKSVRDQLVTFTAP